jgi:hypothetical protein
VWEEIELLLGRGHCAGELDEVGSMSRRRGGRTRE